jgi:LmbE family N-acetylglucosaminyl deacetylase
VALADGDLPAVDLHHPARVVARGKKTLAILEMDAPQTRTSHEAKKMRLLITLFSAICLIVPSHASDQTGKKLRVVVLGGHPDDPESGAGGLIAILTRQGHEVICAYGTTFRDDRRFLGRPEGEVRREEATAACNVLGAKAKFFPYAHDRLVADEATLKEVSTWLAEMKPHIVITHWLLDTHPNHHAVSSLVWQCYQRKGGWNLYFFEVMTDQQTIGFEPDLFLDITTVRDLTVLSAISQLGLVT